MKLVLTESILGRNEMNEFEQKIKALAKEADIAHNDIVLTPFLIRFAKLVASDCAMIAYNSGVNDSDCCANSILYEYADCRSDK